MNLSLTGKRAVVCGSTQGIGKAAALELALLGANVTLVARNEEKLLQTVRDLDQHAGQQHEFIQADFDVPEALQSKVTAYARQNNVDILVNNTGGPAPGTILEASLEEFQKAFSNHLVCNQILVQAFTPAMIAGKFGRIINVISTSVKIPIAGLGVSNTIRGAVASWSKTLSVELAPFGITVNNVLPGSIMTGRIESLLNSKAKKSGKTYEEEKQKMIQEIPAGRIGDTHEIGALIAFLASPAASYINGTSIPVDGGRTGAL